MYKFLSQSQVGIKWRDYYISQSIIFVVALYAQPLPLRLFTIILLLSSFIIFFYAFPLSIFHITPSLIFPVIRVISTTHYQD